MNTGKQPGWGGQSRFYLPNEDARMVRQALSELSETPARPVFVGGSGMVLLDAIADMPALEEASFVDVSAFQVDYFQTLLSALTQCGGADDLTRWFSADVYPELFIHFRSRRNKIFSLGSVVSSLRELFSIRCFFDDGAFLRVQARRDRIRVVAGDIVSYLAESASTHDFIYLSNVPDYLPAEALGRLFAACARHGAPVYLLLTTACRDFGAVVAAWQDAGYRVHPCSGALSRENLGLGSSTLRRTWNRPGEIYLLGRNEKGASMEEKTP